MKSGFFCRIDPFRLVNWKSRIPFREMGETWSHPRADWLGGTGSPAEAHLGPGKGVTVMSSEVAPSAETPTNDTIREPDLRRDFEKVNEQVQRTIREIEEEVELIPSESAGDADIVVEPVYAYRIHASS